MEDVINVYCRMPLCSYALTIPVKMVFKGNYLIVASRCPKCKRGYKSIISIDDTDTYSTFFKVFFQCDICGADNSENWDFMDDFDVNKLMDISILKIYFRCNNCNGFRTKTFPLSIFEEYLKYMNLNYDLDSEPETLINATIDDIKFLILRKYLFNAPDFQLDLSKLDLTEVSDGITKFNKFIKSINKLVSNGYFGPSEIENNILKLKGYVCECGEKYSPKSNDSFCTNCGRPLWNADILISKNKNPVFNGRIFRNGMGMISDLGSAINWIRMKLKKDGIIDLISEKCPIKFSPNEIIKKIKDMVKQNKLGSIIILTERGIIKNLQVLKCPKCKTPQSIKSNFCEECGNPLPKSHNS